MRFLAVALALLLAGCAENVEPAEPLAIFNEAGDVLVRQDFVIVDHAVRPLDATLHIDGQNISTTDGAGTVHLVAGTYAWEANAAGYLPASGTVTASDEVLGIVLAPLPPDWLAVREHAWNTFIACSVNVLVPFGHACALLDSNEAEGNWTFTIEPDEERRSQWRITYVADQAGNYVVEVVTASSGVAGAGGETIAILALENEQAGTWLLEDGETGPDGTAPLDVEAGAKLVVWVRGDVAGPEELDGTTAGYGIGARIDHEGQLFLQQWDPRGPTPAAIL